MRAIYNHFMVVTANDLGVNWDFFFHIYVPLVLTWALN